MADDLPITHPTGLDAAQLQLYARDLRRAVALERMQLRQLDQLYGDAIAALAGAVEARDPSTAGHGQRVSAYGVGLALALGWADDAVDAVRFGALVHDIGKIGVPDVVLRKTGPLEEAEWGLMRQHPSTGARILRQAPFLARTVVFAERHHERWDGRGYPDGLAGAAIPREGRLMAVVDAFDALTAPGADHLAKDVKHAARELVRLAGTQLDPEMVHAFLRALREGRIAVAQHAMPRTA